MDDAAPPEGFRPLRAGGGFMELNGPLYFRKGADGRVTFGARVLARNCNPIGLCHGGWLATLADMIVPLGAAAEAGITDRFLLTVNLSLDFLAAAGLGCWIEGRGQLLRRTKRLVFAQSLLTVEGEAVLRASGVFRIGPAYDARAQKLTESDET